MNHLLFNRQYVGLCDYINPFYVKKAGLKYFFH